MIDLGQYDAVKTTRTGDNDAVFRKYRERVRRMNKAKELERELNAAARRGEKTLFVSVESAADAEYLKNHFLDLDCLIRESRNDAMSFYIQWQY